MALLYPAGEPRLPSGTTARASLAHLLAVGHAGDGAGARRGGAGARAGAPRARLPVQQPRQPAGAQRTHVVMRHALPDISPPVRHGGDGDLLLSRSLGTIFVSKL